MLLTRSFSAILNENPGFRAQHVWVVPNVPLRRSFETAPAFLSNQLLPAVRVIPGVEDAAAVNTAPFIEQGGSGLYPILALKAKDREVLRILLSMGLGPSDHSRFATRFGLEARVFERGNYPVGQTHWFTPGYFATLGIPLQAGRWLRDSDAAPGRILINETLARHFFPDRDQSAVISCSASWTPSSPSRKSSVYSGTLANSAWTAKPNRRSTGSAPPPL
jgi:hypothetical protein